MITPRYTGPQFDPHVAWTKVKASAMKRPYLDCGCRNDGMTDTYLHLGCPRIACKQHAEDPHECEHYEPQAPPREEPEQFDPAVLRLLAGRGPLDSPPVDEVDAVLRSVAAVDPALEGPYPWARECSGEFRHYDFQPPRDGWPGGDRFGWRRDREFTARNYTEEERALARRWRVDLPPMGWLIRETWWDLPARTINRVVTQPLTFSYLADIPPIEPTFRQETYAAKKYASGRWETDPLAGVRRRERAGELPPAAQPESDAPLLDAVLQPDPDDPNVLRVRRPWWWVW